MSEPDDLITRLRETADEFQVFVLLPRTTALLTEAADEIERLRGGDRG